MEIKICQISVRDLTEWLSTGWADWAGSVGFGWTWPLDPKPRHVGPPRSNQNDSLAWGVLQLLHHLSNMADGGKVYAFRSYHGQLSASTAVARGSGTGDPNRGNLLNLVVNKSILGRCHLLHIVEDLWKEKLLWMVWPSLDSLSATTFSRPGMCRALESLVSWYTRSRFSIVGHKVGPTSCLLPYLYMTLLWCCRLLQVLSCLSKVLELF